MAVAILFGGHAALCAQEPASDRLEAYLLRLGLTDLRVRHLEHVAAEETSKAARLAAGQKLADAYAERMMAVAEDAAAYEELKARVERLLADLPQARTPALSVMLLQAEFQRAESLVNAWLEARQDDSPAEAAAILTRIVPELEQRAKELNSAAESLLEREDLLESEEKRLESEAQVLRMQTIAVRATYFAGWGNYYLGVARANPTASSANFTAAKKHFSDVLGVVDEEEYEPVEAEELGLETVWRARTALGLGLAESALGRLTAAAACFRWLEHASAPANLRDEADYWRLKGLINVRRYEPAAELAEAEVAAMSAPPTPGKNSFCTLAIRSGAEPLGANTLPAKSAAKRLVVAGIAGLSRLRQFDTLSQLVAQHKLHEIPEANGGFHLTWLSGRAQFLAAEKTKSKAEYQAAAQALDKALAHPDARQDLFAAGQCRYYLAWCRFRLEDYETAAAAFRQVTPVLREGDQELAVQSNWMEFAAWQALAEKAKEPRHAAAAVAALQALKRDFPSTDQSAKADIYIARLQQNVPPEEAIASLSSVKPGDPSYLAAQLEIVSLRHRIWKEAGGSQHADENLSSELLSAVDRLLLAAGERSHHEERLRACLVAIEILASRAESEAAELDRYLGQAAAAANSLAESHSLLPEYHYRRLQQAQRTKDEAALRESAEWIATRGGGTPYELPALVIVARQADAAVKTASQQNQVKRQEEAAAIYERLAALVGDTPAAIAKTKNALAASSRLAAYQEDLGKWREAADRLDRIVAAFPSDKKYLRRAGLAHVNAGNPAAAVEHWRTLLAGLSSGSDEWLEAKHYQLVCLLATDRAAAEKVWKQFKLLYPEVKSPEWKDKFAKLESQLSA